MEPRKKKIAVGALTAGMVLSIGAISAFAACPRTGRNYIDADGNGICDYYHAESGVCGNAGGACGNYGGGVCGGYGGGHHANGCQRTFIDADGDGICDNYGTRQGGGHHHGGHR